MSTYQTYSFRAEDLTEATGEVIRLDNLTPVQRVAAISGRDPALSPSSPVTPANENG